MFSFFRKPKRLTPSIQLKELAKAGIIPRPGLEERDYLKFREQAYIEKPYLLLLIALGGTTSRLEPVSDRIWHVTRDIIRREGDYTAALNRMQALAQGGLPLEEPEDELRAGEGKAHLSFRLNGEACRWELPWNGSDLDPDALVRLARLLADRGGARQYAFCRLGGSDALVGCFTQAERDRLAALTGLPFAWLAEGSFQL